MPEEEPFATARAEAKKIVVGDAAAELERLRTEAQRFFAEVPEPPLYRRSKDPMRQKAAELMGAGEGLLARAYALEQAGGTEAQLFRQALEAHLSALSETARGRLEEAEEAYAQAIAFERQSLASRSAWHQVDTRATKVYDRDTGTSRYDPSPESKIEAKLACPIRTCRQISEYSFSPTYSTHPFTCRVCGGKFLAFFGEAKDGEVKTDRRGRHYRLTLDELNGATSRVEFDEPSSVDFLIARRDLVALLYTEDRELRGVLNLTSSRLLWIGRGGGCFLATAAYGEKAKELVAFRAFRDEVLARSALGFGCVRVYYAVGPLLARPLSRSPGARAMARLALRPLHHLLARHEAVRDAERAARAVAARELASRDRKAQGRTR